MPHIYQAAEDSYLLAEEVKKFIKKNNPEKILDMGSGSGIQAQTAINGGANPKNIVLADINPEAIKILKKRFSKSKIIKSDLFSKIKDKFDLIIFNPPYLPIDEYDKERDTTGGKKGSEIINKFLILVHKSLKKKGRILLLVSNLTKGLNFKGYHKKMLSKSNLFFEELYIYVLWEKQKKS